MLGIWVSCKDPEKSLILTSTGSKDFCLWNSPKNTGDHILTCGGLHWCCCCSSVHPGAADHVRVPQRSVKDNCLHAVLLLTDKRQREAFYSKSL